MQVTQDSYASARCGCRQLERFLTTPSLVRETSRYNPLQRVRAALGLGKPTPVAMDVALKAADKSFMDVILAQQVKHNIRALAASAANTRLHGAPFRHYLLYGMAHCCLHKRPQYLLSGTAQLCLHNKNNNICQGHILWMPQNGCLVT
jgi:hypothetical protein